MPHPTLTVGSIAIISLSDGAADWPASDVWPNVPADRWEPVSEYLNPDKTHHFNVGSFLIREGDTWTLVDTGYGNRPDTGGGALLGELERADVHPDQITRVLITHMHGDHIGGNTADVDGKPVPVFKNARHIIQRRDWAYYQQPEMKQGRSVIALCGDPIEAAGLLDLIDGGQAISPGISTILTPGHTPGHQSVLIGAWDPGAPKALFLGDVVPTAVHTKLPWVMGYDLDPAGTVETKRALFTRAVQEDWLLLWGHDKDHAGGRLGVDKEGTFVIRELMSAL
jgi:glyoxylase-like metal-dependent hydrolase (beta-lactamase superfamily II)